MDNNIVTVALSAGAFALAAAGAVTNWRNSRASAARLLGKTDVESTEALKAQVTALNQQVTTLHQRVLVLELEKKELEGEVRRTGNENIRLMREILKEK